MGIPTIAPTEREYEVTADFRVGSGAGDPPSDRLSDLQILSVWDQAFIRRMDEPTWYALPRGELPFGHPSGRIRSIRTLDELVPASIRGFSTIVDASESSVGAEPSRHLEVSVDAGRLMQAQAADATTAAALLAPGITAQAAPAGVDGYTMEIWVDEGGIVRKSMMPAELGGETITVASVSSDAWEPAFPTPDAVRPLTAEALLRLGI